MVFFPDWKWVCLGYGYTRLEIEGCKSWVSSPPTERERADVVDFPSVASSLTHSLAFTPDVFVLTFTLVLTLVMVTSQTPPVPRSCCRLQLNLVSVRLT